MPWQIFLFWSILLGSLTSLLNRTVMKQEDSNPVAQTIAWLVISGLFSYLITLFTGGLQIFPYQLLLPNLIVLIILTIIASLLTFKAYKLIPASEMVIFMSTQIIWGVIFAFAFLGEALSFSKMAGGAFILFGIIIAMFQGKELKINRGILFALTASLLWSLVNINGFYIVRSIDVFSFNVYASLLPVLGLLIINPKSIKKINFYFQKRNALLIILISVIDTTVSILLFLAYQTGRNAAQITPLAFTKIILTVIFAAIFLKEKEHLPQKVLGAIIVALGAYLTLGF